MKSCHEWQRQHERPLSKSPQSPPAKDIRHLDLPHLHKWLPILNGADAVMQLQCVTAMMCTKNAFEDQQEQQPLQGAPHFQKLGRNICRHSIILANTKQETLSRKLPCRCRQHAAVILADGRWPDITTYIVRIAHVPSLKAMAVLSAAIVHVAYACSAQHTVQT